MRNLKAWLLLTLVGFSLAACGGGGGSPGPQGLLVTSGGISTTIYNEGTGAKKPRVTEVPSYSQETLTLYPGIDKYYQDVADAHAEGWTGTGIVITTNENTPGKSKEIAPDAYHYTWNDNSNTYACVDNLPNNGGCYDSTGITVGEGKEITLLHHGGTRTSTSSSNVAAGVALVWNKFDELNDDQIEAIVEGTADGNVFNLKKALSPVGNLN